jgi:hypothetical protein
MSALGGPGTKFGIGQCLPMMIGKKRGAMGMQQLLLIQRGPVVRKNTVHVQKLHKR